MSQRIGILLVNLGSPLKPTAKDVRKYLFEFLHDKRVIDTSRWIWCPILHGIILRVRPAKSAAKYASVWNEPSEFPGEEAPLVRITRAQAAELRNVLGQETPVEVGMRYGSPSISSGLDALYVKGCERVCVLPLYPQFSHTTTSAVSDAVGKAISNKADAAFPAFLDEYHTHPDYVSAICESLNSHIAKLEWKPDVVLMSYHGLPQRYVDQGDPYQAQCLETSRLIIEHLGQTDFDIQTTFQSRFGPMEWLQPYTDKTLEALAREGKKNVVVITPGFSADCLETLEEISIEGKELFHEAGGDKFSVVPCLNADPDHIKLIAKLAEDMIASISR